MKLICPSCAVSNRVPDEWAGRTLVCRTCHTLITAPEAPGARARSWAASRGWRAVALAELALAVLAVVALVLLRGGPPDGLPVLEGPPHAPLQLAAPGRSALLECAFDRSSAGGHFRLVSHDIRLLTRQGLPLALAVRVADDPWPETLLKDGDPAPSKPITLHLELELPPDEGLAGKSVRLLAHARLEYPEAPQERLPITIRQAAVTRELLFTVATADEQAALDQYLGRRTFLRWTAFGATMGFFVVAIAACALAQKRVMVICPKCGRATPAAFYYEAGELYISRCPHGSRGPS